MKKSNVSDEKTNETLCDACNGLNAPARTPILQVEHYKKKYGGREVVHGLSFNVFAGEIFGLLGQNGAGKTTLIRSIVGAQPIDDGLVFICDHNLKKEPVICNSNIAYVPDDPDVYSFMTGIEFLNFMADMFNVGANEREDRIKNYAQRFEMMDVLGDEISTYSHGTRQKLVLTSAFLHDPKLLVLDEPYVGLDPAATHELKAMMQEIASRGSAVFFSSHVLEIVEAICDRIAIMDAGKIIASGRTRDVAGEVSLEQTFLKIVKRSRTKNSEKASKNGSNDADGCNQQGARGCNQQDAQYCNQQGANSYSQPGAHTSNKPRSDPRDK